MSELVDEEAKGLLSRGLDVQAVMPAVVEIVNEVQERGDRALADLTERFDGVRIGKVRVGADEIEKAGDQVPEKLKKALEIALENIAAFHHQELDRDLWMTETSPGAMAGQMIVPLDSVGAYVPGGRAAYPSSALMTVVPAKVAGVDRVIVCTPPGKDGLVNPITLVAAEMAGADEIYRVGGVQAVAAMAFGTETIRPVQKIVGPGNATSPPPSCFPVHRRDRHAGGPQRSIDHRRLYGGARGSGIGHDRPGGARPPVDIRPGHRRRGPGHRHKAEVEKQAKRRPGGRS